jgi:hypothetical protein
MDSSETKGFSDSSTTDKITMDNTSLPRKVVSRVPSASVNTCEKHLIPRNISNCRLKKYSDIFATYEVSTQVLGTGILVYKYCSKKKHLFEFVLGISGVVRVATHLVTKRQYAIKTLSREGVNAKRTAMLHNEVILFTLFFSPMLEQSHSYNLFLCLYHLRLFSHAVCVSSFLLHALIFLFSLTSI